MVPSEHEINGRPYCDAGPRRPERRLSAVMPVAHIVTATALRRRSNMQRRYGRHITAFPGISAQCSLYDCSECGTGIPARR